MFAKLNHIAIVSENYALSGKFYESMFGMRSSTRPARAVTVGDGYVGLNINPRKAGRPARLDHFGFEVDDVETAFARMRDRFPEIEWLVRPGSRPYAGISTHDPDGNVFDLSQREMANRAGIYAEQTQAATRPRHISHLALRTLHPERCGRFYRDVFELLPLAKAEGDPNAYLTDGHLTLVIIPWHITDYGGTGIVSPALDHIGFTVDDLEQFKADVERIADDNPHLRPFATGTGPEGRARLDLAERSCPLCRFALADVDGIFLSAGEPLASRTPLLAAAGAETVPSGR